VDVKTLRVKTLKQEWIGFMERPKGEFFGGVLARLAVREDEKPLKRLNYHSGTGTPR
jgi:hypothetical protein